MVVALLLTAASALAAQTPITSSGLGYPVPPVDARAAALGTVGIGLLGGTFSVRNPADLTQHIYPGINISIAPEGVSVKGPDGASTTGRERFSVVRAIVPFAGFFVSFGFGAEFDQDWAIRFRDTLSLGIGDYPFEEAREHDGGMSTIDLSLARSIGRLSLGVAVQRVTGSIKQSFVRAFELPEDPTQPVLADVIGADVVSYRSWRFKAGASVSVPRRFLIGGAVGIPGTLTADPRDPDRAERTFDMPKTIEGGGSALVAGQVLLHAGGGWTGWSSLNSSLEVVRAHDALWGGGGIEYRGLKALALDIPIRVGARFADLPFSAPEGEQVREVAFGGGFGVIFRNGRAAVDLAFEFGDRGEQAAGSIEESFRRLTLSFTLRQLPSLIR